MPILFTRKPSENTALAVWKITEDRETLKQLIQPRLTDHSGHKDHVHWLASRALLLELFPGSVIGLSKDAFNKPALLVDSVPWNVSITHSYEYAAVMVSSKGHVGLDMERLDSRILRVAHKFMSDGEAASLDPGFEPEMLTVIWSAKEAMYKYYGKKELDFRGHLCVDPFGWGQDEVLTGTICKDGFVNEKCRIRMEHIEGYVLTYLV